jgi:hypothetical protein
MLVTCSICSGRFGRWTVKCHRNRTPRRINSGNDNGQRRTVSTESSISCQAAQRLRLKPVTPGGKKPCVRAQFLDDEGQQQF